MKRENLFDNIYKACNAGSNMEKYKCVPIFPRYIDIELTNKCNYQCLMCPTGTKMMSRKQGFMTQEIYDKVIANIKQYNIGLRFIRWGEPTLHKKFFSFLDQAKKEGIMCHVNTNGTLLDEKGFKKIIDLQLESIKFSFQGIDKKSYREMRNADFFEELIDKIERLHNMRGNNIYPYIHVSTTTTYETEEQIEAFKLRVSPYADRVTVGKTILEHIDDKKVKLNRDNIQTLNALKERQSVIKRHMSVCPEVYDKLSINWDGTVTACCGDYDNKMIVGDIKNNSLEQIWNSDRLNFYRKIISNDEYDKIELCSKCYDYIELEK